MKTAYATSGKVFEQVSMLKSPAMYEQLKAIKKDEIVVVRGDHDHVEVLLDTLKIPYDFIESDAIGSHNGGRVMIANCRRYGNIAESTREAVRTFVSDGGRLVTTDWAISLVQRAFPGKFEKTKSTADDVVEIQCHTDLARRLIGMNYAQCHPQWWLEGASDVYKIGNGVTPIIVSEEMNEKYGQPFVAAGFQHGNGEVIHFISHLELQRTRQKGKSKGADLEAFLDKMGVTKTLDMEDATIAELESAYSTLNTLAHLCLPQPLLETAMNSMTKITKGGVKSVKLA